jgi:hypothetical protein
VYNFSQDLTTLLSIQPGVVLSLLHWFPGGFIKVNLSGIGPVAPHATLNLEDPGLNFVWLLL